MVNKKLQLIKNLKNNTYCRIGQSKIHGIGVIAIKNIPKGTNPFLLSGNLCINHRLTKLTGKEVNSLPPESKKLVKDFITEEEDGSYYIPHLGMNSLTIAFYMNHSDNPNIDIIDDGKCDIMEFKTNRRIKKGEELTINYEDYTSD